MPFAFHYNPRQEAPFAIYIAHEDKVHGSWRPSAQLCVTPALRTSGFLAAIGLDEFKSLLLLLTFLSADGRCAVSVPQLAQSLRLSHGKTRARFERLTAVRWQGQAIVLHAKWGGGLDGFSPAPGFIPIIEEPQNGAQSPTLTVLPREVVIEHSRRTYARTREEVEREIEEMMNWRKKGELRPVQPARSPDEQKLHDELVAVGLLSEQAQELIKRFDVVRIRRQLVWLPLRMAKNKAGYLVAAIKDNYAPPRNAHRVPDPEQEGPDEGA